MSRDKPTDRKGGKSRKIEMGQKLDGAEGAESGGVLEKLIIQIE